MSTENETNVSKTEEVDEEFAERFRSLFATTNLSQIGKLLGITHVAVSNYWTGKRLPIPELLKKISSVTNVSIDWLLFGYGNKFLRDKLEPAFNLEDFGGRYKFSNEQIKTIKEIGERNHLTYEEVIAWGTAQSLIESGLMDDENEIELSKLLMNNTSYQSQSRSIARIIKDSFKDERVKREVISLIEPQLKEIVRGEMRNHGIKDTGKDEPRKLAEEKEVPYYGSVGGTPEESNVLLKTKEKKRA